VGAEPGGEPQPDARGGADDAAVVTRADAAFRLVAVDGAGDDRARVDCACAAADCARGTRDDSVTRGGAVTPVRP
jgi:hypothetical protein